MQGQSTRFRARASNLLLAARFRGARCQTGVTRAAPDAVLLRRLTGVRSYLNSGHSIDLLVQWRFVQTLVVCLRSSNAVPAGSCLSCGLACMGILLSSGFCGRRSYSFSWSVSLFDL